MAAPITVQADLLDDSNKLKGQLIVEVGELEELRCPVYGDYDCLTWPREFYRFNYTQCMQVHGYYGGYMSATGLLAVDQAKNVTMFVLSSRVGGSDVKQYMIKLYECP
jgi:hypothetical protein